MVINLLQYVVVCSLLLVGQAVTVGLIYGSPKTVSQVDIIVIFSGFLDA
jgi:hypothetical protein